MEVREIVTIDRPIPRPRWRIIIEEVCTEYNVKPAELLVKYGPRYLVPARIAAARRMRDARYSYPRIGAILMRDHTTIGWYCGNFPSKRAIAADVLEPRPSWTSPFHSHAAARRDAIYALMSKQWQTTGDLAKAVGAEVWSVYLDCKIMARRGVIVRSMDRPLMWRLA
jgi:hypothetical protein